MWKSIIALIISLLFSDVIIIVYEKFFLSLYEKRINVQRRNEGFLPIKYTDKFKKTISGFIVVSMIIGIFINMSNIGWNSKLSFWDILIKDIYMGLSILAMMSVFIMIFCKLKQVYGSIRYGDNLYSCVDTDASIDSLNEQKEDMED